MTTKSKYVDWGGLTPIVNGIRVNATKPGQLGTELTATEVLYLDGLTAGTAVASKALVLDSSGDLQMTAAGQIKGVARSIIADGTTIAIAAADSGGLIVLDSGAAAAFTLPAAVVGLTYDVIIPVATNAATTFTCAAGEFYEGTYYLLAVDTDAVPFEITGDGSADDVMTINGTTMGGLVGGTMNLTCVTAGKWMLSGALLASGSLVDGLSAP